MPQPLLAPLTRATLLGLAVTASIATSRVDPFFDDLPGLAAVHNGGDEPILVRVRNPTVPLDCDLVAAHPELLKSVLWTEDFHDEVLDPQRMMIPFDLAQSGWRGWPTDDCSAVLLEVSGIGDRILFAVGDPNGSRLFPMATEVPLSALGENVVTIVPDSPQVFRPTSPGLLFDLDAPLPDCPELTGSGLEVHYTGPEGAWPLTVENVRGEGPCVQLVLSDDLDPVWLDVCGPNDLPALPFVPGEDVVVTHTRVWDGIHLTLESDAHVLVLAETTGDAPSGLRFEPAAGEFPTCAGLLGGILAAGFDTLDVSVVVGESPTVPGERVFLDGVAPGQTTDFDIELLLASDETTQRREHLSLWLEEARVPITDPAFGVPLDVMLVRSRFERPR